MPDVPAHRLLYRRRIYVPVGAFAAEVDQAGTTPDGEEGMAALRLEFKEAHYNTMQGNYPVDESMAMKLMALELRMKLGAWTSDKVAKNEVRDMLDAHIPPLIMKGKNKKAKTKMEGCAARCCARSDRCALLVHTRRLLPLPGSWLPSGSSTQPRARQT